MKNIIFDVGNVLVKWDPINIIKQAFPEYNDPANQLHIFKNVIVELDAGIIDFTIAKQKLQEELGTTKEKIENLFSIFLSSLTILPESINLLNTLIKKMSIYLIAVIVNSLEH